MFRISMSSWRIYPFIITWLLSGILFSPNSIFFNINRYILAFFWLVFTWNIFLRVIILIGIYYFGRREFFLTVYSWGYIFIPPCQSLSFNWFLRLFAFNYWFLGLTFAIFSFFPYIFFLFSSFPGLLWATQIFL